jgi:hypothetical protein
MNGGIRGFCWGRVCLRWALNRTCRKGGIANYVAPTNLLFDFGLPLKLCRAVPASSS